MSNMFNTFSPAEDAITKCKTLQGEVRELQANLLDINTENTRLQNDNLRLQQVGRERFTFLIFTLYVVFHNL